MPSTDPTPDAGGASRSREPDAVLPVVIGTVLWAAALVVLLLLHGRLATAGNDWWIGVAAVGLITGLLATAFLVRRRRRLS